MRKIRGNLNLSVAVNKKHNGQKITTWYPVSCFGKTAENTVQYLKKGTKVLAECSNLRVNPYTHKDGKPDASMDGTAHSTVFLNDAPQRGTNGETPNSG